MASHFPHAKRAVVLTLTILYVIHATSGCYSPPPGFRRMLRGVDITELDLLPLETLVSNGFKSPVINFTCHQNRTWRSPRGGDFQLPDQVWHINSLPGGWLYAKTRVYKTSHDVKRELSRNVGGDLSFEKVGFSASVSYKNMQNTIVNTSHFISDVGAFDSATQVDFIPNWRLQLDTYAKDFIDSMLPASFESDPSMYNRFIREFGTHYFTSANFGGYIRVVHEISSNYFSSTTEETVETQSKASFFNILKIHGGQVISSTSVDERFRNSSSTTFQYYGGYTNLLADNGIQQWQPTVYNDPWLFSGRLQPISDLISDNTKRSSIIRAVSSHVLKSYLDELERLLATIKPGYRDDEVSLLKSRVSSMKQKNILEETEVLALGNDVEMEIQQQKSKPVTTRAPIIIRRPQCSGRGGCFINGR